MPAQTTTASASTRIAEAIAIVEDGGTLFIESGTYVETVDTSSKSLSINIGSSPGSVTIDGDLTLDANDILLIEAAGTTPGTDHDELIVTGTADLGGGTVTSFPSSEAPLVIRYAPDGSWVSELVYSDELTNGIVVGVAAHPDGTVVMTGSYTGPIDFGQGPLSATGAAFVAKEAP